MTTRKGFEPTTIQELLDECGGTDLEPEMEIRIFSGPSEEWCVLSVYEDEGYVCLDIERVDNEDQD